MNITKYRKFKFLMSYRVVALLILFGKLKRKVLRKISSERGDVPGWVLVVLMTTGLVTAIWTIAAPRLSAILRNSLDAMNNIK
jgi:hypothetical protein